MSHDADNQQDELYNLIASKLPNRVFSEIAYYIKEWASLGLFQSRAFGAVVTAVVIEFDFHIRFH